MRMTLTAQPHDICLSLSASALLLLDMPCGPALSDPLVLSAPGAARAIEAIVPRVRRILHVWRAWGGLVVHARTDGWEDAEPTAPAEGICPVDGELRIAKPGQGAFYRTCLLEALQVREVHHLIVVGAFAEGAVQTTLREAADRGLSCLLLEDAVASAQAHFKAVTLEMIRAPGGIGAWSAPSEALLSALSPGSWWPEHLPRAVRGADPQPA